MELLPQILDSKTQHGFVADVQNLQALKTGKGANSQEGLEKVALEFESIYLKMMLDAMRKAEQVWSKDNPFSSKEQDMFREMLDGQLAKELSAQGSLGLADMLIQQLSPHVAKTKPEATKTPTATRVSPAVSSQAMPSQDPSQQPLTPTSIAHAPSIKYAAPIQHAPSIAIDDFAGNPARFIQVMQPYAAQAGQQLGVDPKLLIAQAALETGWGSSLQASQHGFNMFGIKAGQTWSGHAQQHQTTEVYNGREIRQQASFRHYQSIDESFNDYVALIQSRYQSAQAQAANPQAYVQQLSQNGYATDPLYAQKIISVYDSIDLHDSSIDLQD